MAMRRSYKSSFVDHKGQLIGISFGADFAAEHEWGIAGIESCFGIPSGKKDWGLKRRQITACPSAPGFGWTKGKMPKSKGLYLYHCYDGKAPDFSKYGELSSFGDKTLVCAWGEESFGAFSTDQKEISALKEIFDAFQSVDGAIFLGGGGLFGNPGLVLAIASRIPKEYIDGWYQHDRESYEIDQEVERTGIRQLLKENRKEYFALSPRRLPDGSISYWLNPREQQRNNFGWFTLQDLQEWADGKGKIPKNK